VTIVKIENDGIGRWLGPAMQWLDLRRADHLGMLKTSRPCRR
jgi:hypothetical protein